MHRRAKIVSSKRAGALIQKVEFPDGSELAGVHKITIEINPQKVAIAIIELVDFDVEISGVGKANA